MKTNLRTFIAAIICAFICLTSVSCRSHKTPTEDPPIEFASYIKAYTGNMISAGSPIRIELATAPSKTDVKNLFVFSPSIKGETQWISPTVVAFIPESGSMDAGKGYKAEFALHKLYDIRDEGLKTFSFGFFTAAKEAKIQSEGVSINESDPGRASVTVLLTLSEAASSEDVKKMISYRYPVEGTEAVIEGEGTEYKFVIKGLDIGTSERELKITLDGSKAGFSSDSELTVKIPSGEKFKVISAEIIDGADPYIEVRFNESLDKDADYNGLFTVNGKSGSERIDIAGNTARIHFEMAQGEEITITVSESVRSATSARLGEEWSHNFGEGSPKPAVEMPMKGTILPDASSLTLPFRAVNLAAVDLSIVRIFEDNVLMFLQDNPLSGNYELRRSGRLVYRKTVRLDTDRSKDLSRWQNFSIDLGGIIRHEPGAIYRVRISFKQEYSLYGKDKDAALPANPMKSIEYDGITDEDMAVWDTPVPYYYENAFDWTKYSWKDRDDPMTPSYYMLSERFPECNLLASNIGLMVKSADSGDIWVNVNDILTTRPMEGVKVSAYNFQLRKIGSGETDKYGSARIAVGGKPFVVIAEKGQTKSYLKVTDGEENSLSRFDTGGKKLEKGLKGFAYGERGVWRPGDTLHLALIVDDVEKRIPANHPASVEIYTPQGQFYSRVICSGSMNGFYRFDIPTSDNDPTGSWNAYFKIGGATFHKSLPVETIKPNRLKIETDVKADILVGRKSVPVEITSTWLTGPAAAGLEAKAEMSLRTRQTTFKGFEGYIFSNPSSNFSSKTQTLLETTLGPDGKARAIVEMPPAVNAPGILTADIVTRVTEPGGDVSIVSQSIPFSPYEAYVGIKMPEAEKWYETDKDHDFGIAVVDMDGRRVSGHDIEYVIYRIGWNWWWESEGNALESYVNSSSAKIHSTGRFKSSDKDAEVRFRLDYPDWGRFFIYVKDLDSGHSCGSVFTSDWPSWRGRADRKDPEALTMLTFTTGKDEYEVGEEAVAYIPAAKGGRALVSIENGRTVISRTWVETQADGDTPFRFAVTRDMAPNFYIHITLLQPHSETSDGHPIRMYGVQPVRVSNKASVLHPVIEMPDVLRPQEEFRIKVREKDGKRMTYTLAIVDEGLLDITGFKTPDPWSAMYAREALGIRTWDIYDDVAGAYGGYFSNILSVGGDEYLIKGDKRDNRFNPVVRFLGPYVCERSSSHDITLPMYVGSVRVMVIAGQDGAYGNAEKTVPVRSPLMILPTAPRILGIGETFTLPVNVFAMEDDVRNVKVTVDVKGPAVTVSESTRNIGFQTTGDKLALFSLKTTGEGEIKIGIRAEGNGFKASETVSIQSRNPEPGRMILIRKMIGPGEEAEFRWDDQPEMEFEWAKMEKTGFPAIDFNGLFRFVTGYAHLCTEQICARGISLLNIKDMLDPIYKEQAIAVTEDLLQQLYSRQLPDGGFCYWPGSSQANEWASAMAGHFMSDAVSHGHSVSRSVIDRWKRYQGKETKAYRHSGRYDCNDLIQAYRLYTLALAGAPDNGAMNRLKESSNCSVQAKWVLASAYSLCGKKGIALEMLDGVSASVTDYPESDRTFGSSTRDKAFAMEAYILAGETAKAMDMAEDLAQEISAAGFTTQTGAFAAVAMNRLHKVVSDVAPESRDIDPEQGHITIGNTSDKPVYASVSVSARPYFDTVLPADASGLLLDVIYKDMSGNVIDPAKIAQGTDFTAEITVTNPSLTENYKDLALTLTIPSGWEIFNERLYGDASVTASGPFSYNDIRDDRTSYYFDLPKGTGKTFRTRLTAVYAGSYVLPSVRCEAMYDNRIFAYSASGHSEVTR